MEKSIKKVVIAGGGTAGWMAAAAISKILGKVLDITLIESDEIGTVGVGEASIPPLIIFHRLLDIKEEEFMAATHGTFKLGVSFENWRDVGEDYIHSFGLTGTDHWTAGFQHFWLKDRERGSALDYGDYCLELKAAEANKFAHLPNGGLNYAYQFDATSYAKFLRKFCGRFGVKRVEGKIVKVNTRASDGFVESLMMESGNVIEGDLFIDCTGFFGLLIGKTMQSKYEDWSQWLPCDSAIPIQTESVGPAIPYTRSIAHEAGWQWRIPLQHRVGNGLVYCSRYMDDDRAHELISANIEGKPLTDPRVIKFKPGQREKTWCKNVVALGLSSGFIEPLESTSIHLIQRGIIRLMQMFPLQGIKPSEVDEYNRQSRIEIEHIRDFIILHYKVTNRQDSEFWKYCREMEVPDSLQRRIDLFRETGRVFKISNELFGENSWIQVMMGQGLIPEQYHPTANVMSDAELTRFMQDIKSKVDKTVASLPDHDTYVRQYCKGIAG